MTKDSWTDPDPQPGDFDADLAAMDPSNIEFHEGNPDAKVTVLIGVSVEDARRLRRLARDRRQDVHEVVADLVRSAA